MIYLIIILCYCIAFFILYVNPDSASSNFLFYGISAIPVYLFCNKFTKKSGKRKLTQKENFLNVLQISVFTVLGVSTVILASTKYNEEYPLFVIAIFILFIISAVLLIIWSSYIIKK